MFDLTDVNYIKRIAVGSVNPEKMIPEDIIQKQNELLNRCFSDSPRGRIIGMEKTFSLLNIGEHQVVLQAIIYHIGFARKPYWIDEVETE